MGCQSSRLCGQNSVTNSSAVIEKYDSPLDNVLLRGLQNGVLKAGINQLWASLGQKNLLLQSNPKQE